MKNTNFHPHKARKSIRSTAEPVKYTRAPEWRNNLRGYHEALHIARYHADHTVGTYEYSSTRSSERIALANASTNQSLSTVGTVVFFGEQFDECLLRLNTANDEHVHVGRQHGVRIGIGRCYIILSQCDDAATRTLPDA